MERRRAKLTFLFGVSIKTDSFSTSTKPSFCVVLAKWQSAPVRKASEGVLSQSKSLSRKNIRLFFSGESTPTRLGSFKAAVDNSSNEEPVHSIVCSNLASYRRYYNWFDPMFNGPTNELAWWRHGVRDAVPAVALREELMHTGNLWMRAQRSRNWRRYYGYGDDYWNYRPFTYELEPAYSPYGISGYYRSNEWSYRGEPWDTYLHNRPYYYSDMGHYDSHYGGYYSNGWHGGRHHSLPNLMYERTLPWSGNKRYDEMLYPWRKYAPYA